MAEQAGTTDVRDCIVYLSEERGGIWTVAIDGPGTAGAKEDARFQLFDRAFEHAIRLAEGLICSLLIHSNIRGCELLPWQEVRRRAGIAFVIKA